MSMNPDPDPVTARHQGVTSARAGSLRQTRFPWKTGWFAGLWGVLGLALAACGAPRDGRIDIELLMGCFPTADDMYQAVDLYCLSLEDEQGRVIGGPNCSTSLAGVALKVNETAAEVVVLVEGFEQQDDGRHVQVLRGRSRPLLLVSGERATAQVPVAPLDQFGILALDDSGCQPLPFPLANHTATVFPSGHLLLIGSSRGEVNDQRAALLIDSYSHQVETLATPASLHRGDHRAELLPDGRLVVAGGLGADGVSAMELVILRGANPLMQGHGDGFDSGSDLIFEELARTLVQPRDRLSSGIFHDDAILIVDPDSPAEMFLASTETSDLMQINGGQAFPQNGRLVTVVPYAAGRAVMMGAVNDRVARLSVADGDRSANVESVTAAVGTRDGPVGLAVGGGRVMFLGHAVGASVQEPLIAVFDGDELEFAQGRFIITAPTNFPDRGFSATLLPDGRVYVAGGVRAGGAAAPSFFIVPEAGQSRWRVDPAPSPLLARRDHTASLLPDGRLVLVGGNPVDGGHDPALSMEVIAF